MQRASAPRGARCALALLVLLACTRSRSDGTAASSVGGAAADEHAVVVASRGKVELSHGDRGDWKQARVGDHLNASDALRTESGEADVSIEGVRVRVHQSSKLLVEKVARRELAAKVSGTIESDVDRDARNPALLKVHVDGSDAVARSDGGHFFVTADGRGALAVASVDGAVRLTANGRDVEVGKGQVSRVSSGSTAPSAPTAALRRVLLSVAWPRERQTNKATLALGGTVEPGSRVFVQGLPVTVEPGGEFRTEVPLHKGRQKVAVLTIDALGRRKQVENVVVRDDSLPDVKVRKKLWR
jgi:hypothetical protein